VRGRLTARPFFIFAHAREANINAQTFKSRYSPMHYAAQFGNIDIVEFLCKSGANIDALTFDGDSALDFAVREGHDDVASLLRDRGAKERVIASEDESLYEENHELLDEDNDDHSAAAEDLQSDIDDCDEDNIEASQRLQSDIDDIDDDNFDIDDNDLDDGNSEA
jgi:hypothetical protein